MGNTETIERNVVMNDDSRMHRVLILICWIFFFPITATIYILKNEEISLLVKILLLLAFWILMIFGVQATLQ